MRAAIRHHNQIMRRLLRIHSGYEVKTEGDAFFVVFQRATDAVRWALAVQLELLESAEWPREIVDSSIAPSICSPSKPGDPLYRGLSLRMGMHYGRDADDEEDRVAHRMDYLGVDVIIGSRISTLADGGQIFISSAVRAQLDYEASASSVQISDISYFSLGSIPLKGFDDRCVDLYAIYPPSLAERNQWRFSSSGQLVERFLRHRQESKALIAERQSSISIVVDPPLPEPHTDDEQ